MKNDVDIPTADDLSEEERAAIVAGLEQLRRNIAMKPLTIQYGNDAFSWLKAR